MKLKALPLSILIALAGVSSAQAQMHFNRIASFATPNNMAEGEDG